jgi:hypothetical protein
MTTKNLILKIRNNIATLTWLKAEHSCHDRIVKETYSMFDIVEDNRLREIPQYGFALSNLYNHFKDILDSTSPIKKQ